LEAASDDGDDLDENEDDLEENLDFVIYYD